MKPDRLWYFKSKTSTYAQGFIELDSHTHVQEENGMSVPNKKYFFSINSRNQKGTRVFYLCVDKEAYMRAFVEKINQVIQEKINSASSVAAQQTQPVAEEQLLEPINTVQSTTQALETAKLSLCDSDPHIEVKTAATAAAVETPRKKTGWVVTKPTDVQAEYEGEAEKLKAQKEEEEQMENYRRQQEEYKKQQEQQQQELVMDEKTKKRMEKERRKQEQLEMLRKQEEMYRLQLEKMKREEEEKQRAEEQHATEAQHATEEPKQETVQQDTPPVQQEVVCSTEAPASKETPSEPSQHVVEQKTEVTQDAPSQEAYEAQKQRELAVLLALTQPVESTGSQECESSDSSSSSSSDFEAGMEPTLENVISFVQAFEWIDTTEQEFIQLYYDHIPRTSPTHISASVNPSGTEIFIRTTSPMSTLEQVIGFFREVGSPEDQILILETEGKRPGVLAVEMWISLSEAGGCDAGWDFIAEQDSLDIIKGISEPSDVDCVGIIKLWCESNNIDFIHRFGRDLGDQPPYNTEFWMDIPSSQTEMIQSAASAFMFPTIPDDILEACRKGRVMVRVVTCEEGFVKFSILIEKTTEETIGTCISTHGEDPTNALNLQQLLNIKLEGFEYSILNEGFGYDVYQEGEKTSVVFRMGSF